MMTQQVVVGSCGCNETMIEEVVVGLADILPRGHPGDVGRPGKPGMTGQTVSGFTRRAGHFRYFLNFFNNKKIIFFAFFIKLI